MMTNFDKIKSLFIDNNVSFDEKYDENGAFLIFQENIKNAGNITIVIWINSEQTILGIAFYGVAHIDSPFKRNDLLELINELNNEYRFAKFVVDNDGDVMVKVSFMIDENFNPDKGLFMIMLTLDAIEENIGKFMKLQWA